MGIVARCFVQWPVKVYNSTIVSTIPTLVQLYKTLGCTSHQKDGIDWLQCNTAADRAVVLIHGVTGGKMDMLPVAERFVAAGFAVYSVNLPGHGQSVMPPLHSYDDLSDWLLQAFAAMDISPTLVISNSFASSIVYHALLRDVLPQETKVILACPTPETSSLADFLQRAGELMPERFGWWLYNCAPAQRLRIHMALKTDKKDARRWIGESERTKAATVSLDVTNKLTALLYRRGPYHEGISPASQRRIVVLTGGKDNVAPATSAARMQELLPHATFLSADDAGHILHFEAVEAYPVTW